MKDYRNNTLDREPKATGLMRRGDRPGRIDRRFARRLFSLLLVISLLSNTLGFVADDVMPVQGRRASAEILELDDGIGAMEPNEISDGLTLDDSLGDLSDDGLDHIGDLSLSQGLVSNGQGSENTYVYHMQAETRLLLSDLVKKLNLPVRDMQFVENVIVMPNEQDPTLDMSLFVQIVALEKDFLFCLKPLFKDVRLTVYTADGTFILRLVNDMTLKPEDVTLAAQTLAENPIPFDAVFSYDFAGQPARIRLSRLLEQVGLPIKLRSITEVGVVEHVGLEGQVLTIERAKNDYVLTVRHPFNEIELAVFTGTASYSIALLNGGAKEGGDDSEMPADMPTDIGASGVSVSGDPDLPDDGAQDLSGLELLDMPELDQGVLIDDEPEIEQVEEPVTEPEIEQAEEPVAEPEIEQTEEPVAEPEIEQAEEPLTEPEIEQAEEPVAEPEIDQAEEPVAEPEIEQTEEPVAEPEIEQAEEPVAEPEIEQAEEPVTEPEIEQAEEPVVEPEIEQAEEPVTEPEIEQAEEPVAEPEIEQAEEPVAEPEIEQTEAPVVEPEIDQAEEPVAEPEIEQTEEAVAEPEIEQTEVPVAEPEIEQTEAPVTEPESEQAEVPVTEPEIEQAEEPVAEPEIEQAEAPVAEPEDEQAEEPEAEREAGQAWESEAEPEIEQGEEPEAEPEPTADTMAEDAVSAPGDAPEKAPVVETEDVTSDEPTVAVDLSAEEAPVDVTLDEPQAEMDEAPAVAWPAATFTARTSGVNVSVTADEGAFPEGATMAVRRVWDADTLSDIRQSVADDFVNVRRVQLVDITFYDAAGNEIEPRIPVTVVISVSEIEEDQNAVVVHMDDVGQTEVVEQTDAESGDGRTSVSVEMPAGDTEPAGVGNNQTEVSFEADSFSLYAVVVTETISTHYIDASGRTYNVEVSYGPEAGIPSGAKLAVSELTGEAADAYAARAAEALNVNDSQVAYAKALDISILSDGAPVQPQTPVSVSIKLLDAPEAAENTNIDVIHFGDEPKSVSCALNGQVIAFEAEGFSVYVVLCTTLRKTLTAGDGNEYSVTVTYDSASGIPADAELYVSEIKEGDAGYDEYVEKTASALGQNPENLAFARPFDITLKNPQTGEEYQPNEAVQVSIQLLKDDLNNYSNVDVVHIPDGAGENAQVMDTTVHGEAVEFETDGFSVYVLCGFTVDFTYDGFTYNMAGGGEMLLSELFEILNIEADLTGSEAWFSDDMPEALVELSTVEVEGIVKDWNIKSLAPFTTEHTLIVKLANGTKYVIGVTDEQENSGTWPKNDTTDNPANIWYVDRIGEDVVLTISGSGQIPKFNAVTDTPWKNYILDPSSIVTKIVINDGITQIGENSLTRAYNVTVIDVSGCTTLASVAASAFKQTTYGGHDGNINNPRTVDFSGCVNLTNIANNAFEKCSGITYLDVSGTRLSGLTAFAASKSTIQTLRANNCSNASFVTGNFDLQGYNSLTTLEVSGCNNLTGLINIPTSLQTLDISGCSGLDLLDLSSCTSLTTVKVGNRSDLTDLSWLTLPGSVTTLDASGFTSLTSIDVPASVTSLNLSGCTGLTSFTVPATVTSLNLSGCTGLTALDLSGTSLTNLDVTDCSSLVIYFDGTSDGLPVSIANTVPVICWGDYTYTIQRDATVMLGNIFEALEIAAIDSEDVDSISASDTSILEVNGLTVTNLKAFTETQTLTITLDNGIVGTISVECAALTESGELQKFLDDDTAYSFIGEETTHSISEPAILKQDADTLNLTLSFSEIPEGETGERQMALSAPMTYTFPEGMTVTDAPETVSITLQSGDEPLTIPATVAIDSLGTLTVTADCDGQKGLVNESTTVSFAVPVTVSLSDVPGDYALGNDVKLSAVRPHNVKVSSVTAQLDAESGAIQYIVTVEAESDLDTIDVEYPVEITDLTTGDSPALQFVSGAFTYAHAEGFDDSHPASQVDSEDVTNETTNFTGFPLTVEHMYEGDTITLIYTAKPLHGTYDKETQQAEVQNTVTITNNDNPSNDPADDTASATTTVPYEPLKREYVTLDGSWAYWKVTVNPMGYTLNGGEPFKLLDTFDDGIETDGRQSIDYSSVVVSAGSVTYDYSGNTGTFVIPDNTPVTITYRTRVTAQPGEGKTFRGTAVLKDTAGNQFAASTAGAINEAVVIFPSASDVGGLGNNYMVKLFVYGEGLMQQGIEGAKFILLDANQRALEYKKGDNAGEPVTFVTDSEGYAHIELNEEHGDVSIEKNTTYYLEMMQAVAGYQKDNTLYRFTIKDEPDYNNYEYHNGDTMKVRLYPATPGLSVSIRFSGSYALSEEEQNAVTAVLQRQDENDQWVEVERHPYTDTRWGAITFDTPLYDESLGEYQKIYRVVEENQEPSVSSDINLVFATSYYCMVGTAESKAMTEPQEFVVKSANDSVSVVLDNRYEELQLTIVKMDKSTGEVLPGAEFSVYEIVNGEQSTDDDDPVVTYTTDTNGELVIRGGETFASETLYGIKETKTIEGYLLPQEDEWNYFYFCNDDYLEPGILANLPEDATAVNLTNNGDRITVDNQKEKITIPVMKLWQGNTWPEDGVTIGLYRSVEGDEAEPVAVLNENDNTPRTVTLTKDIPYNNTAFKNLDTRDADNRNYIYSIKEEKINDIDLLAAGYNQEYGISSAGVYIVRNKPATTLTVSKEWYLNGEPVEDSAVLAEQSPVTFDVYRSSEPFVDSDPDDGITNADMTDFVSNLVKVREKLTFGEDGQWTTSIPDLDKEDDLGNRYYYYVLEQIPSFGNELYEVDDATGTIAIKNVVAPETVSLTVTKAALVDDPRPESLDRDFEFTLKLQVDETHPIRSWQVVADEENPENDLVTDWNGEAKFTLKPTNPDPDQQPTEGASITLTLPVGVTATVTETYNPEYTVETISETEGSTADDGRTFSYTTTENEDASLTYTNTLHVICKVVTENGEQKPFESLKSALKYIRDNEESFASPWTIYMLEDYTIPVTDEVIIHEGERLTLTTASTDDTLFPFEGGEEEGRAVITRGGAGGSMLKNTGGTLTLTNIILDGGAYTATGDGGLICSVNAEASAETGDGTGDETPAEPSVATLNLNAGTTLRNSAAAGKGGAVYAEGIVNLVDGVEMTGNSAPSASAFYLNGTLNMTGGSITGNTGAADGAVVVESTSDRIKLSQNPVIADNTNDQGKAANLYIGVDSDSAVNVVGDGLDEDARIGVTAMEGHMLIGQQFATAEYDLKANLDRFINDVSGYRGKMKDGTSSNIVWNGLTLTIQKELAEQGANANDRFTITLTSSAIVSNNYIIDGTLEYTITQARQNRPGKIVLRDVQAGEDHVITISPLPVGEYTIEEDKSNYTPSYAIVETGSDKMPDEIADGKFTANNDSTVIVTNTRRLADVRLTKTLDDRLKTEDEPENISFTVKLTEADGTAVSGFTLADGIATNDNGEATFVMNPSNGGDAVLRFKAPVGATMTITEADDPNYTVTASAFTAPEEGEGEAITDADTGNANVFAFPVTDDGANVTFANERKMAEIELRKNLVNKVSATESFTFTVTLTNADGKLAANYVMYRDADPDKSIVTGDDGKATVTFDFLRGEENTEAVTLTIPEGTKLVVTETEVKKTVNNKAQPIYDTKYSIDGQTETTGLTATINSVSESNRSIVFTNTRKTQTITVKNTVNGYSGNVVPFTYTATVTDGETYTGEEGQDDYDVYDFSNGAMTFELATGQSRVLTVPYGATLTVTEGFIVGYDTTVKRGNNAAVRALSDSFVVTANLNLAFTNTQQIGMRLVNSTSSDMTVTVSIDTSSYSPYNINRVSDDLTGQVLAGDNGTAEVFIEAGMTAILEIDHKYTDVKYERAYTVSGNMPAAGYYYTINNEPSFHEYADPAILRVYNTDGYEVKGKLRYSVNDSTVTFTDQPLVSFDVNGGAWTTEMEDYHWDDTLNLYQKAVTKGEAVAQPTPDPIYPTAGGVALLGWTSNKEFAELAHTADEVIPQDTLYDFNTPVSEPFTLYAVWARDPNARTVTVRNALNTELTVSVTLTHGDPSGANYTLYGDDDPDKRIITDENGQASFTLAPNATQNLSTPNGAHLVISAEDGTAYSTNFTDADSEASNFTIDSVDRDGTVSFIGGIFKITDVEENLLYNANGDPAVYSTLAAAFTAYAGTLYTDDSHTTTATPAAVKQLVDDYTIQETTPIAFPNATMTLTTAGKDDADFPYAGVRDRSTIYRSTAGANNNCFTIATGNITLTNIILDGGSENGVKIAKTANGGLISMNNASGVLNIETGTTLRNCAFAAYDTGNNSSGGAICMTNGTLNVKAGLFSNLHARRGGAINVTGGTLNITGTNDSIRFENCGTSATSDSNNGGDGGAIFYSAAKDVTFNGGNDKDNPGIIFVGCVAGSNWGDGGAIFANTSSNYEVSVSGCSFTECSARNTTGKNDEGYGGGGIGVQAVKKLTVSHCSFNSCDSMKGGGGILARVKNNSDDESTVSISDCLFLNCSCKAQGGALAAYTDNNGVTGSKTKLYIDGCTITNCSSGTDNGSGGAIQCYLPCLELNETHITDCWAGKEGGGINHYFGSNYAQVWPNSKLTITGCTFTRCRAEDRYDPTALQHYGGGVNSKAKTAVVTGSTFVDCVSTLKEGGALHLGGEGGGSTATVSNSTFKNCTAKNGGGALLASNETLTINNCKFYGCESSASNGGAVYHYQNSRGNSTQKTTTIKDSTFSADPEKAGSAGCSAANNGGAIWTRANTNVTLENLTIQEATAGNYGGGVYLDAGTTEVTLAGGSISECRAVQGSAVYVGNKAVFSSAKDTAGNLTDSPLSVTGNIVSGVNDGAIHGGKLYFEGNVVVEDNTCSSDSTYNHDVLMQNDNVTTIYVTSIGLNTGASIGVYVPDSVFNKRGLEGKAFGSYDINAPASSNYLDSFFNDRDSELYGYQASTTDSSIYWGIYVCKITDEDGNTLKRANGRDAVYQRISLALDEFNSVTGDKPAKYIKMLVENYNLQQTGQIENFPADADITLTTETYTGDTAVEGKYDGKHPYRGTEGTVCTISRTNSTNQLFKLNNSSATFRLENITLDGRKDKTATQGDFRLIEASAGALVINRGTTMQYGRVTSTNHGGAVYASSDSVLVTVNGFYDDEEDEATVKFINCVAANNNGGAIYAKKLQILNNSEEADEYGTVFINCTADRGGAVCVEGDTMEIADVLCQDCHTRVEGGAFYHNNTGYYQTTVDNCAFTNCYSGEGGSDWSYGGAITSLVKKLEVKNSRFTNCYALSDGGAINHGTRTGQPTETTLENNTFTNCRTTGTNMSYSRGGAVSTRADTTTVTDCSFTGCTSTSDGGALYSYSTAVGSSVTVSGTTFENCSVTGDNRRGGAISSKSKVVTLQSSMTSGKETTINRCTAPGFSGAVHMDTNDDNRNTGLVLNIKDSTVISGCYAKQGGAIYLKSGATVNLTDSPEFTQNGYKSLTEGADQGACIYLAQGSRINIQDSPKFSRNILPTADRVTNGTITDYARQDIYMAGYASNTPYATNAASIYVTGELTGDVIWVWPEQDPHRKPNEQFAKIADDATVSDDSLSHFRNALTDGVTGCSNGEYLAGVKVSNDETNVYWDKMYLISFKKKDNKGVAVPGAGFTLYSDADCTQSVATATSADGENDTDAQGKLLEKGTVEFTSIRMGAYYMKETTVPTSFKENNATYLVLVGTPYLKPDGPGSSLWKDGGPLNVVDAATLVARYTTDAGKYYGIFPLDENNKAVLRANLASNNVGIENIRNDYQAAFMKVDSKGDALPGAAFTIYTAILDSAGQASAYQDGYPELVLWSRDGENYPKPVVSADGTSEFRDVNNRTLPKGLVYFRELPLGTYYLLETAYPERNGSGRRTFYEERDRVFKLDIQEDENNPGKSVVTLSEWKPTENNIKNYEKLVQDENDYYTVSNQEVACKLTDGDDNLLYVQGHKVRENKDSDEQARLFPAVYATLEEGFEAAQHETFVDANGIPVDVSALKLKVLKDFTLSRPVVYDSDRVITFTTAEKRASKDRYIFSTTRTTDTSRAQISRAYNEDVSENANAGALITLADGAKMTLQNIRLNGQKTSYNGRAIHVTGESTLTVGTSTRIENFKQEAAAGSAGSDLKGGAILMDDGTSLTIDGGFNRTAIFYGNTVVNNRADGDNTGSDGGAIAVGEGCTFSISNAQFSNNQATAATEKKGNGGAVSINKTKDAEEMLNLPVHNVRFLNNTASYQGGALRVAENCSLKVDNCTFSANRANTFEGQTDAPGEGGAIAVLSKKDSPSSLTITGGTFTGNSAVGSKGGAVKIGGYGTLTLDGMTMSGNEAANGGAVTVAPGANVTMTQGTLSNNTATDNGGAFYVEGNDNARGTLTVNGGTISGNKAALGSAIYAVDYAAATVTDAVITGNTASENDGGAINVGGDNARLYFGGEPTVFDNLGKQGKTQQMNLVLSEDSNAVINTTVDGLSDGIIGVFVVESADEIFTNHGLPGKPFGTFGDVARLNPQVFRSDHALSLYGVKNGSDDGDGNIYWVDVICKLTDADNNILYQDISLTINGNKEIRKGQAVYARITEYDDQKAVQNGFNALRDGFDAAQDTLYTRNGNSFREFSRTAQTVVKLKMLKDAELDKSIQAQGSRMVTFTTAEMEGSQAMRNRGDFFLFRTDRANAEGKALIKRAFNGNSMIRDTATALTLTGIVLDGGAVYNNDGDNTGMSTLTNGGIVNVAAGKLIVADGATLRNSAVTGDGTYTGNGGAAYVAGNATAELTGGEITGNSAANGGAVYTASGATMEMKDGKDASNADTHGTINGNTATTSGAGIYLEENSTLKLSGSPDFGGAGSSDGTLITSKVVDGETVTTGNFVTMAYSEKKNGGMDYPEITPETDPKMYSVRQDIFMTGYLGKTGTAPNPATSIVVTGALSPVTAGEKGYIWVWAEKPSTDTAESKEEDNHYEMLKQFAVFAAEAMDEATMQAFRNAQDDETTGCGADYLTGQGGDDLKDATGKIWKCIYWTGGFDFVFRKVDGDGEALPGATFTLFKANATGDDILRDATITNTSVDNRVAYQVSDGKGGKQDRTAVSKTVAPDDAVTIKVTADNGTTVDSVDVHGDGLVVFEKIPPGAYFIKEEVRTKNADGTYTAGAEGNGAPKLDPSNTDENAPRYKVVEKMYRVVINGKGWYSIHVAGRDSSGNPIWDSSVKDATTGTVTWPNAKQAPTTNLNRDRDAATGINARYVVPTTDVESTNVLPICTVLNESPLSRKVILRKVDEDNYASLSGAHFHILRADLSEYTEGQPTGKTWYESGTAAAFFIGKLPFGTYYLVETVAPTAPAGYNNTTGTGRNIGKVFKLTVDKDTSTSPGISVDNTNLVHQLTTTGTEDVMIAAFRRFMNTGSETEPTTAGGGSTGGEEPPAETGD